MIIIIPNGIVDVSYPYELTLTTLMGIVFDDIDVYILFFDVMLEGTDGLPFWAVIESDQ